MAHLHSHSHSHEPVHRAHSEQKILAAFLINLFFALFEAVGGLLSGSIAILSDSLHDLGDAASLLVSYVCEKKSRRKADLQYTFGYTRYSLIGGIFLSVVLICGSVLVIEHSVTRLLHPTPVSYDTMLVFAAVGFFANTVAVVLTHGKGSLNQKAVNLHLWEDVVGWAAVLLSAVVMKLTGFFLLDAIVSLATSIFLIFHSARNFIEALHLFLERVPSGMDLTQVKDALVACEEIEEVHHVHLWALDEVHFCATMHLVTDAESSEVKARAREILSSFGIEHATLELESKREFCAQKQCFPEE